MERFVILPLGIQLSPHFLSTSQPQGFRHLVCLSFLNLQELTTQTRQRRYKKGTSRLYGTGASEITDAVRSVLTVKEGLAICVKRVLNQDNHFIDHAGFIWKLVFFRSKIMFDSVLHEYAFRLLGG